MAMGNKMIQPRFNEEKLKLMDKRAKKLGFIKSHGEVNMSAYVKYCVDKDLESSTHGIIIDGDNDNYSVE